MPKNISPTQQFNIDLTNAKKVDCSLCGGKLFIPVVEVYKVSALVSPTGQELIAQVPVLICMECKVVMKAKP